MEFLGITVATVVAAIAGGAWLALKIIAPKTEQRWDDKLVDQFEGLAAYLEVDPDEMAKKSVGRLKQEIVKKK